MGTTDGVHKALVDAATAAYEDVRREVYDQLCNTDDPGLSPHQRQLLVRLAAAEYDLQAYRDARAQSGSEGL